VTLHSKVRCNTCERGDHAGMEEHREDGSIACSCCGTVVRAAPARPGMIERITLAGLRHVGALMGFTLVGWLLALAAAALLFLPGCFNAAEQERIERAHAQAQEERNVATLRFRRGEIDGDAYQAELAHAEQVEAGAQQQATESATARWIGDLFDPAALSRDVVLVALGAFGLNKHRNRTRRRELDAMARGGAP
jgi:uncharacterized membrane protein